MKLVLATRNRHKLEEIRAILDIPSLELASALDFPDIPEVEEDGQSFEANALKKALTLAMRTHLWALADDSGLEVDALDGRPGIYSARFAGEPVDYQANNRKLLALLDGQPNRGARFRCVMALASPAGKAQIVEGLCAGRIIDAPRGDRGFGYDPVFVPDGHEETFAEMDPDQKNRLSHRARAVQKAREKWGAVLRGEPQEW